MRVFFLGLAMIVLGYFLYLCLDGLSADGQILKWAPGIMGCLAIGFFCFRRIRVELAE